MNGESVDAYAAMWLIKEALEEAGSTQADAIRTSLSNIKLCSGPASIVAYDCIDFDATGQNKNASLVVVQIRDNNGEMERVSVWPKNVRHAGYTPVFPQPAK